MPPVVGWGFGGLSRVQGQGPGTAIKTQHGCWTPAVNLGAQHTSGGWGGGVKCCMQFHCI